MEIQAIRTDEEHLAALAEIGTLWGALPDTEDGDRLDLLIALVEIYEGRRWPINRRRRK
jgi:HTH-type transcriptional regulator / antitoxin HigA